MIVTFFTREIQAENCQQDLQLQILGSGGPELDDGRSSSSYLVWYKKKARILLDTGSGSSVQFGLSDGNFAHLDVILLSHLHTDHSADLPAFVKGSFFTSRDTDLKIFGPAGNTRVPSTFDFVQRLFGDKGAFSYLSDYLNPGQESYVLKPENAVVKDSKLFKRNFRWGQVTALSVDHGPIPAVAWRVDMESCSLAYSGDMSNKTGKFAAFARGVDLLIMHMAIGQNAHVIAKNLHMEPSQIADIIAEVKPKAVLLSHFMHRSERSLQASLNIIRDKYQGPLYLAEELLTLPLKAVSMPPPAEHDSVK